MRTDGVVEVVTGTQSTGQGHETSFAQVMADRLGVTPQAVRLVSGDTRRVVSGGGSHSDRSMRLGGALLVETSSKIIERARAIVAHRFGLCLKDVHVEDGCFVPKGGNERLDIFRVAEMAEDAGLPESLQGPLAASASFTGRTPAYPTGAAVCELETDSETGCVEVTRYTSIDDVGQSINPLILHGQVHGGIVQGLGQALSETIVLDSGSG